MRFWLPQATIDAAEVDYLILALLLVSCAILALVFGLIWVYMIKYRAGSPIDRGALAKKTWRIETAWTVATLLVFLVCSYGARTSTSGCSSRLTTP
jgi:cytochrome c oxidase subunit II